MFGSNLGLTLEQFFQPLDPQKVNMLLTLHQPVSTLGQPGKVSFGPTLGSTVLNF